MPKYRHKKKQQSVSHDREPVADEVGEALVCSKCSKSVDEILQIVCAGIVVHVKMFETCGGQP